MNDRQECLKNQEMLGELFELYEKKLYGIAFSILHQAEQAEDAVQDAFLRTVPYLSSIRDVNSGHTKRLLVRIVKSTAIDRYRRNQKERELFVRDTDTEEVGHRQGGEGIYPMRNVEDRETVKTLLEGLDPIYREIIQYRCFYELSYREIGAILEIGEDTAAKRFERAKKLVLKQLRGEAYGS